MRYVFALSVAVTPPAPHPASVRDAGWFHTALPAYLRVARMWQQVTYVYRASLIFNTLSILIQVYLLNVLWTTVYAGRSAVGTLSLHTVITSLTLANLQLWLMYPTIARFLYERVREGKVAADLARPVGFMGQMIAQQVGASVGRLPFVLVALPLALVVGALQPPASPTAGVFYAVSLLLAYMIGVLSGLLLGMVAFWTLEMRGILGMYHSVSQFFGGAMIPPQFFSAALGTVAALLPFQAQAYLPLTIYLGQARGSDLVAALRLQVGWVAALSLLAGLVWHRALRRVVIQGG